MLQSIRDHSQGWLTGVIVFLVCAAFALWGIHDYVQQSAQPDIAAKVNGFDIHQTDLNMAYERLRQQQQNQLGADFVIDQNTEANLKKQALDQLVLGHLLAGAATKEGYRVSKSEVYGALLSIPAFQVNGRFSKQRFNEVLSGLLYNENSFLEAMQNTMLANQVRSGFVDTAFALPSEVNTAIQLVNQKRDMGYLIVPSSRFINNISISDTDANLYYQQHKEEFTTPEQVSIDYLKLSLDKIATQQHFTDAQLQQYYQNNIGNYTKPEHWQISHILVKVASDAAPAEVAAAQTKINNIEAEAKSGTDFDSLEKKYSDESVEKNEALSNEFDSGTADPEIEKAVAALKPGQVSAPLKTKYGFAIIKLLSVKKPEVYPFDKVRAQVEKALAHQQAEQIFADANDKLSNLTYANPNTLDIAAKSLGITVESTPLFDHKGGRDQLTANPKIIAAAFSPDVLQGTNSNVIAIDPNNLIVLRIKQHKPAVLLPFAEVQKVIVAKLKRETAEKEAQAMGEKIIQQLNQGKSPEQVASQEKLTWKTANSIGRYGEQAPSTLIKLVFKMPRPKAGKFAVSGFKTPTGDYAVLVLNAVHDGDSAKSADGERRVYREELENSFGQLDYSLYAHGLLNSAKIVKPQAKSKIDLK